MTDGVIIEGMSEITFTGWTKSTYSFSNGACVEVASAPRRRLVGVRDSKDPSSPVLVFAGSTWGRCLDAVRRGEAVAH